MNTQQPKALYLASELRAGKWTPNILQNESGLRDRAADELERLHNENEALCAALAAVAQPVAWAIFAENGNCRMWTQNESHAMVASKDTGLPATPLYVEPRPVAQVQDARTPLTDGQLDALLASHGKGDYGFHGFARAIEAAHGIHP